MKKPIVFITGASGFIGSYLVRSLLKQNFKVRAGVHNQRIIKGIQTNPDLEVVGIDICNKNSLKPVLQGVDHLYHFAASVNTKLPAAELYRINVEGTKNVWETACEAGITKALYCSTTAVYGLLSRNGKAITEDMPACAVEPYGRSKLEGENAITEISKTNKMHSIIIRPTAVFGPGDHTLFGKNLRRAAYSRLLLSGGFQNKKFNYVHVQDVADAAIFLMENAGKENSVFNININDAISYEHAFESYMRALAAAGWKHIIPRVLGNISRTIEQVPGIIPWLDMEKRSRFIFRVWKPGFDLIYSSQRLLASSFRFKWQNFENVIVSCLNNSITDLTQSPN